MPEGHTLHRLARRQQKLFGGQRVRVSSPQGRFADEARLLDGRSFAGAQAWGKHLIQRYLDEHLEHIQLVHIHLGLYGAFTELDVPAPEPVGQIRMRIIGESAGTDLRGPTACELYTPADLDALISRLGPDPLRRDADPERAWSAISRSTRPIGALLMDQKVIAGVGNVYRAEVLFRAGIDPQRAGTRIERSEFDAMWADLVALMRIGVRRGRIHVVRPDDDHGPAAYARDRPRTYVYRRGGDDCRVCGGPVSRAELDGRNLFWCTQCQR